MRCNQPGCVMSVFNADRCKRHYEYYRAATRLGRGRRKIKDDPGLEEWTQMCKSYTARQMAKTLGFGHSRQHRLETLYGMSPYMRCRRCGMLPREQFSTRNHRLCKDCEGKPVENHHLPLKQKIDGHGMDFERDWVKKPWGIRVEGIGTRMVQGFAGCQEWLTGFQTEGEPEAVPQAAIGGRV